MFITTSNWVKVHFISWLLNYWHQYLDFSDKACFKIPEPNHTQNNAQCSDVERIGYKAHLRAKEPINPCVVLLALPNIPLPNLCRGNLSPGDLNLESSPLPQSQNLESLEICQRSSLGLLLTLLCPWALLPQLLDTSLLPLLLNNTGTRGSWKALEDEWCEDDIGERDCLSGNSCELVCCWAIDKSLC
ncbi:hypothetical protein EYC80_006925 [Monilinia laxa]|uniref:Uncharacterized protein n=1 Tax=Monilinia laxa TaxID=61186 RepID=A0A5N6JZM2_MONLA|nr:hypothetical protein EYC80_006925 [Monilinia laxa]